MAQEYTVTKAFQSTDQGTKEVTIVPTKGGDMHKFLVQVANQPVAGWLNILKKPGNEVKEGDKLFGDITENQWGKPQFTKADRPFGSEAQTAAAAPVASGDLEAKIDYLTSLIENFLEHYQGTKTAATDVTPGTDGDGQVNLSELPY